MLDADTKRRIDTARDILVGKVPDPKSQVEQITIALIYKFMDDIDAESEEWGGEREFFAGDFARYGWAKLMHPGLGGHETLMLYAEALNRMPENPGVPALFRDIFSNAYLPYRDPETLREFLKVINEFSYADSERLGDAFEYLLSVLDSQGDAGQFRTPRHIIDFIGKVTFISGDTDYYFGGFMGAIRVDQDILQPDYLYWLLREQRFNDFLRIRIIGANINNLSAKILYEYEVPLPPLEVQREIVAEIENYQKVIAGARAVVENYRPHIAVDPEWPMVELGEVCKKLQYGISARLNTDDSGYKTFRMSELVEGQSVDWGDMKCADISTGDFEKYRLIRGDILFNRTNSIEHVGRTGIFDLEGSYCFASYLIRLSISENMANPFYVNAFMNTGGFQSGIKQYASRAIGQSNINAKSLAAYRIPLPSMPEQNSVVAELEAEKVLVEANRELIRRFGGKIQAAIGRVWSGDIQTPPDIGG